MLRYVHEVLKEAKNKGFYLNFLDPENPRFELYNTDQDIMYQEVMYSDVRVKLTGTCVGTTDLANEPIFQYSAEIQFPNVKIYGETLPEIRRCGNYAERILSNYQRITKYISQLCEYRIIVPNSEV